MKGWIDIGMGKTMDDAKGWMDGLIKVWMYKSMDGRKDG